MARGRKPKPRHLKLVQGNPGKRRIDGAEPSPEIRAMAPPRFLDKVAAEEWRRLMPALVRWGLFTSMDRAAFAAYCAAFSQWRTALTTLKRSTTYTTTSRNGKMFRARPEVAIANEALRKMLSFGSEFGLTPAARVRLKGTAQGDLFTPPADDGKTASGWDALG